MWNRTLPIIRIIASISKSKGLPDSNKIWLLPALWRREVWRSWFRNRKPRRYRHMDYINYLLTKRWFKCLRFWAPASSYCQRDCFLSMGSKDFSLGSTRLISQKLIKIRHHLLVKWVWMTWAHDQHIFVIIWDKPLQRSISLKPQHNRLHTVWTRWAANFD